MTPEERDRLTAVETRVETIQIWLKSIDHKLDELVAAANMGRGAWWIIMKIGGLLVVCGAGIAWLVDKLWK